MSIATVAPLLMRLLACSASAAVRAGACIHEVLHSGELGIVAKGRNDLQTQADRDAQRLIIANLRAAFPGLTVIGEEKEDPAAAPLTPEEVVKPLREVLLHCHRCPREMATVRKEDLTVWVDPLDGTSEFADNLLDSVTVLVGVALAGRAVAGVVYQPYHRRDSADAGSATYPSGGRLVWGLNGLGVFGLENAPARAAPTGVVVATTRSHGNQVVEAAVQACQPTQVLRVGGCGHKVLLLLERRAHVYVYASDGCNKWDTCAPEALLTAAGGRLTDIHGRRLPYHAGAVRANAQGILAALRPEDHERCARAMPAEALKQLPP